MSDRGTILLVEDEPNIGMTVKLMLGRCGHAVTILPSGQSAMAWLQSIASGQHTKPRLIVSDYHLNDLSGLDIFQRAQELKIDAPRLLISGDIKNPTIEQWSAAPSNYFLSKPFSSEKLLNTVRLALQESNGKVAEPRVEASG